MRFGPFLFLFCLFGCIQTGCDSATPGTPPNEEELITTVRLVLAGNDGTDLDVVVFRDLDGAGGAAPVRNGLILDAGVTYTGRIGFTDEANGEDITAEVGAEDEAHQVFYTPLGDLANWLTVTPTDTDENNLPVGLLFQIAVAPGVSGNGQLNVVLSHFDEFPKDGTTRSNETDVDITIDVEIR